MKSAQKWIMACIFTVGIIAIIQIQEQDGQTSKLRTVFTQGRDLQIAREFVLAQLPSTWQSELIPVVAMQEQDPMIPTMATYESMQPYENGVIVSYTTQIKVFAREDGIILFTGHTRHTGKTMTVLYNSGDIVTYGFVENFSNLPYTAVSAKDLIAEVKPGSMYVKVERGGKSLDSSAVTEWMKDVLY
ncbi:hypothetical protein E2636_06455 [Paenisporosarcina antarctica]|uniref:M23 family metallopeptidase n=2 Tax=Paenisporosarcina antarctica TaxID=417367 RepID=A0A4P7A3G3_9BACL|nr:hypothetical protein E2636_06455 [Paenisporosarcina antarctica]